MSTIPQSLLVAVDVSEASGRAVALGGVIADRCGAVPRLLHADIADVPPDFTPPQIEPLKRQQQATRAQAEQALSQFGRPHTNRSSSSVVESRSPVEFWRPVRPPLHRASAVCAGTHQGAM